MQFFLTGHGSSKGYSRRRGPRDCYLGQMWDGGFSACTYTQATVAVGGFASFVLGHSHALSVFRFSAAGGLLNYRSALAAAGAAMWLAAGLVLGCLNQPGFMPGWPDSCDACSNPHPSLRTAVWALALVTAGLYVLSSISYAVMGRHEVRRRRAEELSSQGVVVLTEPVPAAAIAAAAMQGREHEFADASAPQCSWHASSPNDNHTVQIGANSTSHIIMSKYK
ncbi:hypothetical protein OEZ85_001591 [Tetradesmus obliquus]|uniref:Amino acid transporter transmembrane domain-containing protein n=1 Tax=Tetradesmus obliquus TaxID=3088 RepID=A0ABY8U0A6_TETOB|nr:hypothetical protein OEZ85_001591 [Tetradesmus obliquus]